MKKTFKSLAVLAVGTMMLSSCAMIGTQTGTGSIFTSTIDPVAVTSNNVGKKVGTAKASNILGLAVTGDAGVNAAAKNGGIKKISHVDVKKSSFLGIFGSTETTVYGE